VKDNMQPENTKKKVPGIAGSHGLLIFQNFLSHYLLKPKFTCFP